MLKTINDSVFGEITYKYSWFKEDEIIFFGKLQKVKIKIKAFKDEEILQSQRDNYKIFKWFIEHNLSEIYKNLQEYCEKFYKTNEKIEQILELMSIYFARDGSWGMLFESKYDVENGLAIFFNNDSMIVNSQDMLL
ncbi:DUF6985 domain-containing protein [Campylobacter concisus]